MNKRKPLNKRSKNLLPLLFVLLLNSCASVPDVPLCVELSMDRGYCVYTVSAKEFEVDDLKKFEKKTWYEQRNEMIRLPVSSWVEFKSFIIKMCSKYKCDKEISTWDRTVEKVDEMYKKSAIQ